MILLALPALVRKLRLSCEAINKSTLACMARDLDT